MKFIDYLHKTSGYNLRVSPLKLKNPFLEDKKRFKRYSLYPSLSYKAVGAINRAVWSLAGISTCSPGAT